LNKDLHNIIFCDIEAHTKTKKVEEIGLLYKGRELRTSSLEQTSSFLTLCNSNYIAGHNFIDFDMEILKETSLYRNLQKYHIIDTLPLSLLLFNEKTIHSLPKNYKSEDNFKNDPVEDSKITLKLFMKLEERFLALHVNLQNIFYSLLKDEIYFSAFFKYMKESIYPVHLTHLQLKELIMQNHKNVIINSDYLEKVITTNPIELAYILAILTPNIEIKSHPPKILFSYPEIVEIQKKLCFDLDDANRGLSAFAKDTFGFGEFRTFTRLNAGILDDPMISQREIVEASLRDESFLAILPTGGGKTFTFWLPAVYKAKSYKSLTVIISPLQALIEDHIKSFNANVANFKAVAISGFMSPLERSEAIEQVVNGEADILYIAPESLRSNLIFGILKNRLIERFVVDEAHCLSTWGNDFRQDYYYICEYIKELLDKKPFQDYIPISCFTATAKPSVIEDIEKYFFDGLDIRLDKYLAVPERKNLTYKSIPIDAKNKYKELLRLINENDGSTLVYIPSSTKDCDNVAQQLSLDTEKNVKSFHSKIDSQDKMTILQEYLEDKIDIIVATTAFGMGVDKANITNVIHYEVSDSLESYAQEAGRGARNQDLIAFCPILFDEDDLDKHFISLSRSKLTASEINSIFRVIKNSKSDVINKTAFELAKDAGWDVEDSSIDYTTKVKTALLELEREGYISRKRNTTNFFADSITSQAMERLHQKLQVSNYEENEKQKLILVLQTILGRGKVESIQVDELAYLLGYEKHEISLCINQLKEMDILGDSKDLSLELSNSSIEKFKNIQIIELLLFEYLKFLMSTHVTMRELNEYLHSKNKVNDNQIELIKSIIKNWKDKSSFLFKRINREQDLWHFQFMNIENIKNTIVTKHTIATKILSLFSKELTSNKKETIVFSLKVLHEQLDKTVSIKEIDRTLLYLHHLDILELLNGRFISYSPMNIHIEEKSSLKRKYTEYKNRLEEHYKTKIESIHIMGEYAKRLKDDDYKAILFLKDYFTLPYDKFKKQYKLLKEQISRPITQKRFNKIFEKMSNEQKEIIEDTQTKAMMILAGPGSGKTKVLVHKIASLILTEDIKPEQFMMLTFSKTAKWEFKSRLNELIGSLSYDVEIQTFHSYALKLIARVVKKDDAILNKAIEEATRAINNGNVKLPYTTVLVLDEFQDINDKSFKLVKAIYNANNKDLKIIAVGDDDQCIMNHIGADVTFIDKFEKEFAENDDGENLFKQYELLCNFRSHKNIVEYSNNFISTVKHRYKHNPLYSSSLEDGLISIYTYNSSSSLVMPIIKLIKQEEKLNNIAILAFTNDEVMQIYSLLQENGIQAKYIIEREKFELKNIIELVEFNRVLNSFLLNETSYKESYFEKALKIIEERYKNSTNIKLLYKIVDRFMNESDEYYISQWVSYLEEIKIEDFEDYKKNIVVSTIHKSKGMEFDKVFLLVNNNPKNDIEKRLYYVGMTRAKNELSILRIGNEIQNKKGYVKYRFDDTQYRQENRIFTHVMSLADINLGFDVDLFSNNSSFFSGTKVRIEKKPKFTNLCIIHCNRVIATFSALFQEVLSEKFNMGYTVDDIIIENVVVWFDKEKNKYLKHPLCKIVLSRNLKEVRDDRLQ
jgi:ATP-dependent DNA helicase RecQ